MRAILPVAAILFILLPRAAAAQPNLGTNRGALIDGAGGLDASRRDAAVGRLVPRTHALTPCEPFGTMAFSEDRVATSGIWTGRFEVMQPATGAWSLVVVADDGSQAQRIAVEKPGQTWQPLPIHTRRARIRLEGPGTPESRCPLVMLQSELVADQFSTPRGQFGKSDDRWARADPRVLALADAAQLHRWGDSVVRLQIGTAAGQDLPCSGFFITRHILMTARHCVASEDEARATFLFLPSGTKVPHRGTGLLAAQESLDFSLVWVDGDALPAPLALDASAASAFVLWQHPPEKPDVVSVHECVFVRRDGERVFHQCDSSNGSSGSPVQARDSGAVVALHTRGCPDAQHGTLTCQNYGINAGHIKARIKQLLPDVEGYYPPAAAELKAILSP